MRTATLLATSFSLLLAAGAHAAPDAAQILRESAVASGSEASDGKTAIKIESAVSGQGLTGTDVLVSELKDGRYRDSSSLGPTSQASGFDGKQSWNEDSSQAVNIENGGDALPIAINNAYRNSNLWWRPDLGGALVKSEGDTTAGNVSYHALTITPRNGKSFDAWFDAKTHLLARIIEQQGSQTVTFTLSDYRVVEGVQVPYKTVVDTGNGAKYLQTMAVTKVQFVSAQADSVFAPPNVTLTDFSISHGERQTQFPFRLINNHIYADVAVNGQGPLLFILDSGGADILTPETAKALGLKSAGATPMTGVGDQATDTGLAQIDTLTVGDATLQHQVLDVLDFVPNAVEGVDVKGMLGFEIFKRFVTRIDYGAHTITLIDPKIFDPTDAGTPVKFVFNGHLPEVKGSFEGIPAQFDIDTGARNELTLTAPFVQSNGLRAKHPSGVEAVDGWGVGGSARGYVTRSGELAIGSVKIPGVVTSLSLQTKGSFSDASYQGNIGGGTLKRFIVTFDYANQTMYLKALPEPIADIGVFDRSGMWINAAPDGIEVMDVSASGPAQIAGIRNGDVITAVDGKPASSIPVYELRRQLRDEAAGTVVVFSVKQGIAMHQVKVTLRDQI